MIFTFNTETIVSRKWIMLMTLIPAIITDLMVVFCNKLAWCFWGVLNSVDIEKNPELFQMIEKMTPHVPILSLATIVLSAILIAYLIYIYLVRSNQLNNKKLLKYFSIIVLSKAVVLIVVMYFTWYSQNVDLSNSVYWYSSLTNVGERVLMILPFFYIPIIMLICKNKDRV